MLTETHQTVPLIEMVIHDVYFIYSQQNSGFIFSQNTTFLSLNTIKIPIAICHVNFSQYGRLLF